MSCHAGMPALPCGTNFLRKRGTMPQKAVTLSWQHALLCMYSRQHETLHTSRHSAYMIHSIRTEHEPSSSTDSNTVLQVVTTRAARNPDHVPTCAGHSFKETAGDPQWP